MQHCFSFKVVDQMFQDIQSNNCLFRGLVVIIKEDSAQILSIVC